MTRHQIEWISAAVLLAIVAGMAAVYASFDSDLIYYSFRYAENLAQGAGYTYNPGAPTAVHMVAPLHAGLLAFLSQIGLDLPSLAKALGVAGISASVAALYGMAHPTGRWAAAGAAALLAAFVPLWLVLSFDSSLWLALCLLSIFFYTREWGIPVAITLALATLTRLETGVLAAVLVAASLADGRPLRIEVIASYLGIVMIGGLWLGGALGNPLPGLPGAGRFPYLPSALADNAFTGLAAWLLGLVSLSPVWALVVLAALGGLLRIGRLGQPEQRWLLILLGWALLHLVTLSILRVSVFPWTYLPLAAALAGCTGLAIEPAADRTPPAQLRWGLIGGLGLLIISAMAHSTFNASRSDNPDAAWRRLQPQRLATHHVVAGQWIAQNSAPTAQIGTTLRGGFGYYAQRPIIDYQGDIVAANAEALRRGDEQWWLAAAQPDYVVLAEDDASIPTSDPWFQLTYQEIQRIDASGEQEEALLIYQRTGDPTTLSRLPIGMTAFNSGLTLNTIATDFRLDPLESDRRGRLRLEWWLEQSIEQPQFVSVRLVSRDGRVQSIQNDRIDFSLWPQRQLLTSYHNLEIGAAVVPGVYDLEIGIGSTADNLDWQPVALAKVPFPSDEFLGAVSGIRVEFGDIRLDGYRLSRTEEGAEVVLIWETLASPPTDYQVLIQMRDASGVIAAQMLAQPLNGAYPTSVWSPGERIPDTHVLDLTGVAVGEYDVVVGLVGPDDSRLISLDGQTDIFLGRLTITNP
ncbi:MAG: hypothetical protein GYB68_10605 [Chloroflexi bacterium]|nr:hypothetical protein [Chloroflexota bacterium]